MFQIDGTPGLPRSLSELEGKGVGVQAFGFGCSDHTCLVGGQCVFAFKLTARLGDDDHGADGQECSPLWLGMETEIAGAARRKR